MQWRYKRSGEEVMTKRFNHCEVFVNNFHCRYQVDDNNNHLYSPISVDRNWGKILV